MGSPLWGTVAPYVQGNLLALPIRKGRFFFGAKRGFPLRTFAIVNQKGGCGKTTTSINLAAIYARRGLRTLLIDMDPQAHCAAGLGVPEEQIEHHIGDAMTQKHDEDFDKEKYTWEITQHSKPQEAFFKICQTVIVDFKAYYKHGIMILIDA